MRILIVNVTLAGRTGTETVVRDLAFGLRAAGQAPMVYSPRLGEIADEIAAAGIPVVSKLADLPHAPDIIHGNHHVELVAALLRFPRARALFVCHDRLAPWSAPPVLPRILRYVAVDLYCRSRLTVDYRIPEERTCVIYNAVDTARFVERTALPRAPARAMVFSNYAGPGTHLESVQAACDELGLPLDALGSGVGRSSSRPEQILGDYDVVFAKARCALEAMAVGAAVILCDQHGLGPMVTRDNFEALRPWNFGRRTLRNPLDSAAIAAQIRRYDPDDAGAVSRRVREEASLTDAVAQYLRVYDEVLREPVSAPEDLESALRHYLEHTAARVTQLSEEVIALSKPYRMEPLPDAACADVTLSVETSSREVARAGRFNVPVKVENRGDVVLSSLPPTPVYLSYRWFDAKSGSVVVPEGPRTELRPVLGRGIAARYVVVVTAPAVPGDYTLRLTLVQEWVLWFDLTAPSASAEMNVAVV